MKALFTDELFDTFFLNSAVIKMYTTTTIDGHINEAFFRGDESFVPTGAEYVLWKELRPFCLNIIKGRRTPLSLKLVLSRDPASLSFESDISGISALHLKVLYEENVCTLTTGVNYRVFSGDRAAEQEWDAMTEKFLTENGLKFDPL